MRLRPWHDAQTCLYTCARVSAKVGSVKRNVHLKAAANAASVVCAEYTVVVKWVPAIRI